MTVIERFAIRGLAGWLNNSSPNLRGKKELKKTTERCFLRK